jgi:PIN domain nuclease of toxin-antitoxin system
VLDTHALVWWVADAAPDPADRIIAASAIALESRLVTADRRLRRTPRLEAVW